MAVTVASVGGLLVYAGFRGVSPLQALRDLSSGSPTPVKGNPTTPPDTSGVGTAGEGKSGFANGSGLLAEMQKLGNGKKYSQLRRTGPDSYDCSGLVWRAGQNLGLWPKGTTAFNTASFIVHTSEFGLKKVSTPEPGDIVWWVGHMGVATDATNIYSALSSHSRPQIGTTSIASIDRTHGPHRVYRFAGKTGVSAGGGGGGGGSW
jgi:cell wall-associated NlpC family hydrolase